MLECENYIKKNDDYRRHIGKIQCYGQNNSKLNVASTSFCEPEKEGKNAGIKGFRLCNRGRKAQLAKSSMNDVNKE